MRNRLVLISIAFGLVWGHLAGADTTRSRTAAIQPPAKSSFELKYPAASPLARIVGHDLDSALGAAATDFVEASAQADAALMLLARYGTDRDIDAFRETAFTRRLIHQMSEAPEAGRADLLAFLIAHPDLAHTLVFCVTDKDDVPAVYALLDRLRTERPQQLVDFPELATALCVVRDRDIKLHINENLATAAEPLAVFDFYVAHEKQMFYGLHGVPVELLAFLVDTTASISDMNWAIGKYAGTRDVGSLFFSVKYDYDYLDGKSPKKLDKAPQGFNLPDILQYGGVCVDQAYFAVSVGKAIGVPSALVIASSAEAGHAWVGYLKPTAKSAEWDFNSGRYEAFQGIRGNVTDPQTGEPVADSTVGLLGDLIGTKPLHRQDAVALVDAANLLNATDDKTAAPPYPPALLVERPPSRRPPLKPPVPRAATAAGQLDLIEMGLRQFASYPAGWEAVADLARDGKLSIGQKQIWSELVQRLCGKTHPDFALSILEPMIDTVDEPHAQSAMWEIAFRLVQTRPDLAAEVRFHQARLWERQQDLPRAGKFYADVVDHDINAGPFALKALRGAEEILHEMNKDDRVLALYAAAAKAVVKPDLSTRSGFIRSSNWYKVREEYAAKLADAGRMKEAQQIQSEDR